MKILSIDTTTRDGSLALLDDERIVDERQGDGSRTHAERLPADILALLHAHGVELADIALFAVASGPGSFTGLRVGIATMQGFATVGHRPIVGVSALEALAHAGSVGLARGARVAACMDGYRRDVFAALFEVAGDTPFDTRRLIEIEGPTVGDPAATVERWRAAGRTPAVAIGDGATRYADQIAPAAAGARIIGAPLLAGVIGRLALVRARAGSAGSAAAIQPLYVRRPDAELAREGATPWPGTSKR